MQTKNLFSKLMRTGATLLIFTAMLAALIVQVTGAAAAPPQNLSSLNVGTQTGTLATGTAGSVTYNVTVNRNFGSPSSFNLTVSGLPAGASGSFSVVNPVPFVGTANSRTVTLTINTTAAAAAGSTNFTVQAAISGSTTRTGTGTLVIKGNQTITFGALANKSFGDANFNVSATASSGLAVSFAASGACTVTVASVHLTGAGSCTITASQAGNTLYNAAPDVAQTFTIAQGSQTITFGALPDKYVIEPDFSVLASASSGLTVSFAASGNCTVAVNVVHLTGVGSCTITASQAGDVNYLAAPNAAQTFTILAAPPIIDLYAKSGSTTLPGLATPVTVLGYSTSAAGSITQPGGPTLVVNQGTVVAIVLHNNLAETTSLLFQGQAIKPDLGGAPAGGTSTYIFTANQPGTYLYEAGLRPGAQHQVAMGLYGALVVRPAAAGQAYASASTAFDAEQVLLLSEIDTNLNATPASFDMRKYAPQYFLINGKAYPATAAVSVNAGNKVLLRYVNAGLQAHAMSTLGLSQTIIAQNGSPYAIAHKVVSETIATGQTLDTIVTISASAVTGASYPLYDANMLLHNSNTAGAGGMVTVLTVGTGAPPPPPPGDTTAPVVSGLALLPATTGGATPAAVTVNATVNDATLPNSNISAAEFYIDSTAGTPTPMTAVDAAFDSTSEAVTGTISTAVLTDLTSGNHTIYVRGRDSATPTNNWSAFVSITLVVDKTGPTTSALVLTPNPSSGAVTVDLTGTGDDTASGNSNVTAAEYWIDAGAHVAMAVGAPAAPVNSLSLVAPIAAGLSQGTHVVHVRSQDVLGNWGAEATIDLVIGDTTSPVTANVTANPNPNNGAKPLNSTVLAVRVAADFSDVGSSIAGAEGFIDTVGATGTGFVFVATDGAFNSATESGYADVPLVVINALSDGPHLIQVHARDASGIWGTTSSVSLLIDRTVPTLSSVAVAPSPTAGAASVTATVTAADAGGAGLNGGIYWIDGTTTPPASPTAFAGTSSPIAVNVFVGALSNGSHNLRVQVYDAAGNVSTTLSQAFTVSSGPLYFSTSGNTNPPGVGGTADDADIYLYNGTAFSRSIDVTTIANPVPSGANVDGFDRVDATHYYLSFNGNVTLPGLGTVQDEDVVFYNAGTWSVYFDGTPAARGLSGTDVDAISVVGGVLYFSTDSTTVPAGVSGGGDDADIYSWNGTSFSRVYDASVLGWSTANVDGFTYVDATHFYLSYSADTNVPVLGAVQDEDVLYYNNGVWSIYFDGTSLGLTNNNHDVDAFDLP